MKILRWLACWQIKRLNKRADFCEYMVICLREDMEKYAKEAATCRYQAKNFRIP